MLGTIAGNVLHTVTKLAATEGFHSEMEKISHNIEQVWSKLGPVQKMKLKFFNPGAKASVEKLLGQGRQMAASNTINATLGKPLVRNLADRPAPIEPFLPQKDTYRKPGEF